MSTPCSFAYLATAFVWAQTRPLWLGSLAIVLIGVGMSLPYIMLVLFPQLVRRMPRPGRWMELFKHAMGFVLLGVAIWLLTTLPSENLPWVLGYAIVLSACLWMWGRWVGFGSSKAKLWTVRAIAAALAIAAGWWMLSGPTPLAVDFGPFDRQAISAAVDADRPVLIDFTADWCLNCKTVENTVYRDSRVGRLVRDKNVLAIKGDVTDAGSAAALMLEQELGEPGVPVSVLFVPGQPEPVRFHGVFSADALVAELEKLPDSPPTGAPPDDSQTESP
jgi:thiol:disulfide interchange protein DsbD